MKVCAFFFAIAFQMGLELNTSRLRIEKKEISSLIIEVSLAGTGFKLATDDICKYT